MTKDVAGCQLGGVAANSFAAAMLATSGWRAAFVYSGVIVGVFAPVRSISIYRCCLQKLIFRDLIEFFSGHPGR